MKWQMACLCVSLIFFQELCEARYKQKPKYSPVWLNWNHNNWIFQNDSVSWRFQSLISFQLLPMVDPMSGSNVSSVNLRSRLWLEEESIKIKKFTITTRTPICAFEINSELSHERQQQNDSRTNLHGRTFKNELI